MSGCAVEVKDLTVRFGNHVALEKVSLCVPAGARLAIVGPNGAGKSTLLRVILGLVPARQGTVSVGGEPPARIAPDWIAYVPQIKTLNRSFPAVSEELVIRVGSFKRHILLPRQVAASQSIKARLEGQDLSIIFKGEDHG